MRAYIYLNSADGHFFGFKPEHMGSLTLAGVYEFDDTPFPEALERVFAWANGGEPDSQVWYDMGNRSLSVGDAVLLEAGGFQQDTFVCEPSGWKRLLGNPVRVVEVTA